MVGLADLNFPGHSLCTPLLTRASVCSRCCFAKMLYKRKRSSYDASHKICVIEYVFLEQINVIDLYAGVIFWMFFNL